MSRPDLSIIILNYKMDGLVKNCLKSIFAHDSKITTEVIVVDNDSKDNCEAIVTEQFPQASFIQSGNNHGHAKGNNLGITQATGRYVMILNPDTVFLHPILDTVIEYLDQETTIGMSTVQLTNPDRSLQAGAWKFHELLTPVFQRIPFLKRSKRGQKHLHNFELQDWDRASSRDVDWVQGSCLVVRREALDQIGLLDERFFLYFTDVDWCRRAWEAGWRVHYYADAQLIHYYNRESAHSFGLRSLLNKTTRIHIKDWLRYLHKYRGTSSPRSPR